MTTTPTPRPVERAMARLGEFTRTWRLLQRLTVAQVADRAGVANTTVLRLEKGQGSSLENTLRIARALGILDILVDAVDPYASDVGRLRADEALPQRVRTKRTV